MLKNDLRIDTPTMFVIFGATGDLGKKKLIPALYDLFVKDLLPEKFMIIGFSRASYDDDGFRSYFRKVIEERKEDHDGKRLESLLPNVRYIEGRFEDKGDYTRLGSKLEEAEEEFKVCTNKLFHLAVPPSLVGEIVSNLASSGLTSPCSEDMGWTRVLVEKPFGKDISTARRLDDKLAKLFKEIQIFRIDHYLAKNTIQDILFFRFSNLIFEPVWNNKYIDKVDIRLLEDDDIGSRGNFYDGVGALRDVGQNHILQMLSLITMENPGSLESSLVRHERARLIKSLKPLSKQDIAEQVTRGQYEGYRETDGVDKNSSTETYFKVKAFIDNKRWHGVPIYLESGKGLSQKKTDITIEFKQVRPCLCPVKEKGHHHTNRITFSIQPDEAIYIRFWARKQGLKKKIEPKDLSFRYNEEVSLKISDYESIILDCMKGDQMLFASTDEIQASWNFITPVIDNWDESRLKIYKKGSEGP